MPTRIVAALGPPDEQNLLLGGGVELAVTDSISREAQHLYGFPLDGGGNAKDPFTGSPTSISEVGTDSSKNESWPRFEGPF